MAIHHFQPARYYTTLAEHEPALRIADGDTVITSTVDGAGHDAADAKVADWPNPQTGPFYVEGADPGDTLGVRLDRLAPNRDFGHSSSVVVPNIVDPSYVRELPPNGDARWK